MKRKPVVDRAAMRMRAIAGDRDVDLADAVAAPFLDIVNQIHLGLAFEQPRVGLDVGKNVAFAAIQIADDVHIVVHRPLIEELAAVELKIFGKRVVAKLVVADERHIADFIRAALR